MCDVVARTLVRVLAFLRSWSRRPRPGPHQARCLAESPYSELVSPWARPWTGPTKEQARVFFRQQAETTLRLRRVQRRRWLRLFYAPHGIGVPCADPGVSHPRPRGNRVTADALTGSPPEFRTVECCDCGRETAAPIAVRWIPRASGSGTTLYACPECEPTLTLGPTPGELTPDV